jgi:hypothetical protein
MYSTCVTVESLEKVHGKKAADVFNQISALGGHGVRATDFAGHEGGLAINSDTQNLDKIKALIEPAAVAVKNEKEGK